MVGWATIGMAAGIGQEMPALVTTLLAWLVVSAIPRIIGRTPAHGNRDQGSPED